MIRFSNNKDINKTANALIKQGWTFRRGGRHVVLNDPITNQSIPVPYSPSCRHASKNWHNAIGKIQRAAEAMLSSSHVVSA